MKTEIPKTAPLSYFSRTALSLVRVHSITAKNRASGSTSSTMGRCNLPAITKTERLSVAGSGSTRRANHGRGTGGFDDEEQKHGVWKRYHPNGQLWDEGRFEHGKKKGTWKVYDESGELLKTQNFK